MMTDIFGQELVPGDFILYTLGYSNIEIGIFKGASGLNKNDTKLDYVLWASPQLYYSWRTGASRISIKYKKRHRSIMNLIKLTEVQVWALDQTNIPKEYYILCKEAMLKKLAETSN